MFKVNHRNTRNASVSIVNFEEVNAGWAMEDWENQSEIKYSPL